ncbi:MAG: hypothetical protein GXN93_01105, partial [Candidatus Diapherotrites archaeon]|nr:hypothetical protein [Candidatus Diapherotrites archaeon]
MANIKYTISSLEELPGVGKATVAKLNEAGIESLEDLEGLDVDDLIEIGLSKATAKKIIRAFTSIRQIQTFTADQVDQIERSKKVLRTETPLDDLLGGGFKESYLYEFYGQFATGKSEVGHTLAVRTQLPEEHGGLNGKVVFIDTENTFSTKRIKEIASCLIKKYKLDKKPEDFLKNIIVARTFTSTDLYSFVMSNL